MSAVRPSVKVVWRSVTTESGAQSAVTVSATLRLVLPAASLASGTYCIIHLFYWNLYPYCESKSTPLYTVHNFYKCWPNFKKNRSLSQAVHRKTAKKTMPHFQPHVFSVKSVTKISKKTVHYIVSRKKRPKCFCNISYKTLSPWLQVIILHWLRVPQRIEFKLAVLVYRCLCGTAPSYLADELRRVSDMPARQRLRCASTAALDVPVTRRCTIGDRSFSVAAARVWNSLPADVTSAPSLLVFRRLLKTELCRRSFPDN